MNKKLAELVKLLGLVTIFVPGLVMGMEKQIEEKGEKTRKNTASPQRNLVKNFVKNILDNFPRKRSEIVLRKLQKNRKKIAELREKNNPIAAKDPCPICQEEIEKHPYITLHKAQKKIPHKYHVHCLYNWILHINPEVKIPLDSSIDQNESVELECLLCHECDTSMPRTNPLELDEQKYTYPLKKFPVNKAELQKKYLEYLKNNPLPLQEYFSMGLATLPFGLALELINKYKQLNTNDKNGIAGSIDDFDGNIQKFLLSDRFFTYKKDQLVEAKKTFELLSENISAKNTYFDLLTLHWDLLNQEQRSRYFKKTFRRDNKYARTWRICNKDRCTIAMQLLVLKSEPDSNLLLQTLDDIFFCNLLLVAICANDLPLNLQNDCLEAILVDSKDNETARKLALGIFRARLKKDLLDVFDKKYLAIVPIEKQLEDVGYYPDNVALQVLEKYANLSYEDQKILCKNNDSPGILVQKFVFKQFLDKYENLNIEKPSKTKIELANLAFKLTDKEPTIFIQFAVIIAACLDSNKLTKCFEKAMKKTVSIVPDKELLKDLDDDDSDDDEDMPSFEKAMSHKNDPIVQELMENTTTLEERKKRWLEYTDYLKIAGLAIGCLAKLPADKQRFYLKKIIDMAPAKSLRLEMEYKIFSALSPEVRIEYFDEYYPKFTDNRKEKTLLRLKKQLTQNKAPEEIKQLILVLKNNGKVDIDGLMLAFGTRQERFSAFCSVLKNLPKATYYITDIFRKQCAQLTQNEQQPYLNKMVEFVNNAKTPREIAERFNNIFGKLKISKSTKNRDLFLALYKLVQKNTCYHVEIFESIFPQLTKKQDKIDTFSILCNNITSEPTKKNLYRKWWNNMKRLVVSAKELAPFKKDYISKPLAVSGMLCSLSDRLKK